jgi:tellurite resistance protein TerC
MLFSKSEFSDPGSNVVVKLARRFFPISERYHGEHFVVRAGTPEAHEAEQPGERSGHDAIVAKAVPGALLLTPLALALIMVETSDLIFAVDSIPAIFAITGDAFLVFTSNVFAVLGLRTLYFALAGMVEKFKYLKPALRSFCLWLA